MTRHARQAAAALKTAPRRHVEAGARPEIAATAGAVPGLAVTVGLLLVILTIAAVLRIAWLTSAPPGLNQDEAVNAWNAWCLLKTGNDQTGASWPLLYFRALGENRTTLYLYFLLPFEALGGLNVWTNRLPSAVGGVLTVLLLYGIGSRLGGRPVGLVAAALLAVSPWHIQLTRIGHEAAIGPLMGSLTLGVLLWAGFPLTDRPAAPRIVRALLAGLVIGIGCYSYPAIRLFIPALGLACVVVTIKRWWALIWDRRTLLPLAALALGVAVTFGPLLYYHLFHSHDIARRAERIWLWEPSDGSLTIVAKVVGRYLAHFSPDFLFVQGDRFEQQSALGFGPFPWYTLPMMAAGLIFVLYHAVKSPAARVMLAWVLVFPVGDCLNQHGFYNLPDRVWLTSLHALRSAPGEPALEVLAALGAVVVGRWLWHRRRAPAIGALVVLVLLATWQDGRFLHYYFGEHSRRPSVYRRFQVDLVEACAWLKPRLADADAVFVTHTDMSMPYVVMMVALGYDPQQWFREERDVRSSDTWDQYLRVGKIRFLGLGDTKYPAELQATLQSRQNRRVLLVLRPGEAQLGAPERTITGPKGEQKLQLYDLKR